LPVRPATALEQRPFEELSPRFRIKENHFVSKSAGEICASRHNPASYLITLPRAIIQFSFVLPSRFHPQIFLVDITSLQIKYAHADPSSVVLNVSSTWTRTFRSHQVPVVYQSGSDLKLGRRLAVDA
jgi:hypothetical protein